MCAILPLILLTGGQFDEVGAELVPMHHIDPSSEDDSAGPEQSSSSSSRADGDTVDGPSRLPCPPVRPPSQLEIDRMPR
jgi:hypothetical protein